MKSCFNIAVLGKRGWATVAAAMILAGPALGQEPEAKTVPFEGTQAFCHILDHFKLRPVKDAASFTKLDPAESVLIVFGDNTILADIALDDFKLRGGAVLIASDRDDQGRLNAWKLRIDGEAVSELKKSAYKRVKSCPFVRRLDRSHPLFRGMSRDLGLATNLPGRLHVPRRAVPVLASFSENCRVPSQEDVNGAPFLVASLGTNLRQFIPSRGSRVVVMAGHSVFMNGMIAQPDNDNWAFAWNCVRWLSEGPKGPRKHALFVEEGRVKESFDVPLAMPMPPLPTVQLLNGLLRGLEEENFFNRALQRFVSRQQVLRAALILGTVTLIVLGWRRLGKSRFRQDARVPRAALEPAADFAEPPSPMEERHQALLQKGNYWEPGRALARFFFEEVGKVHSMSTKPVVTAHAGWWQRQAMSKQVQSLWELAYGPAGHVSARALARLPATLDYLAAEIRAGRLLLQSPPIH